MDSDTLVQIVKRDCDFEKLISYIKSDKIPYIKGFISPVLKEKIDTGINLKKKFLKKLPISPIGATYLGFSHVFLHYDIDYSTTQIVCKTSNPDCLKGYFIYHECVTFTKLENNRVEIIRESTCRNMVDFGILSSLFIGDPETEYNIFCLEYLDSLILECNEE